MRIGWFGLGSVGTGMVLSALRRGHDVTVYPRGKGLDEVLAAGARRGGSHSEVAAAAEILGVCLFSDDQVAETMFREGALAAMPPGSVVASHTTGSPALARELGRRAPQGVSIVDATFSGSAEQARDGRLVIIAGGEAEAIERARPLLESYAATIHHAGPLGQGQIVKLLNNFLFAANLRNAFEIFRLGRDQGLDVRRLAAIVRDSSGASMAAAALAGDRPMEEIMAQARRYLVKDLAAAGDAGLDMAALRPTIDYFSGEPS